MSTIETDLYQRAISGDNTRLYPDCITASVPRNAGMAFFGGADRLPALFHIECNAQLGH